MIEKTLGDDTYRLDTQNSILSYSSYEGEVKINLDEQALDFDIGRFGDGCGGGRLFILFGHKVQTFNPENREFFTLVKDLNQAKSIKKKGCDLFLEEADGSSVFNLTRMEKQS